MKGKLIFFIVTITIGIILFKFIFFPSYISFIGDCEILTDEEIEDLGFFTAGQTSIEDGKIKVCILVEDTNNLVKKHERVHVVQILTGKPSLSCETPIQLYFAEVEANTMKYLPDKIFIQFYGDFTEKEIAC